MKKNKMMRLASFLLVATLLTTSMISGTFAKYVTSETGGDSARVAKFGVEITANGEAFSDTYKGVNDWDGKLTVNATADVVAPGTSGDLVAMTLKGQPEVAVRVDYVADLNLDKWVLEDGTQYCPVYFTINGKTYGTKDTTLGFDYAYATVAELVAAVETAIGAYSKEYEPFTNLAEEAIVATPDVSWTWAFENGYDAKDTWLGNEAAKDNAATVELAVTTTVTQID